VEETARIDLKVRDNLIHCQGCERRIEDALKRLPGVLSAKADHKTQIVRVGLNPERTSTQLLKERLAAIGYETF